MIGKNKGSILAVDNAVMFLNSLKRYLQDEPYELSCVNSGEDALVFLKEKSVDLILMDVEMPEMSGYELAKKIQQSGIKTPIVFITANSEKEDMEKADEAGAAGVLTKPFRPSQLVSKIKEFIS
ncbi:MAG: response regulator [Oscillospiraceae bacterium]|nr:response regulator [Oscillospiraceae bacterium]